MALSGHPKLADPGLDKRRLQDYASAAEAIE
jgi:hypothetical protein